MKGAQVREAEGEGRKVREEERVRRAKWDSLDGRKDRSEWA